MDLSKNNEDAANAPAKPRASILKRQDHVDELDPTEDITKFRSRKVSFGRKSVKMFATSNEQSGTIWHNSYEEQIKYNDDIEHNAQEAANKTIVFDSYNPQSDMDITILDTKECNDTAANKENVYPLLATNSSSTLGDMDLTEDLCHMTPNKMKYFQRDTVAFQNISSLTITNSKSSQDNKVSYFSKTIIYDQNVTSANLDITEVVPSGSNIEVNAKLHQGNLIPISKRKTILFDPNTTSGNLDVTEALSSIIIHEANTKLHQGNPIKNSSRKTIYFDSDATSGNLEITEALPIGTNIEEDAILYQDNSITNASGKTIYFNQLSTIDGDVDITETVPPRVSENINQKMCQDKSIQRSTGKTIYFDPNATSSNLEITEVLPLGTNIEEDAILYQGNSIANASRKTTYFNQLSTVDGDVDITEIVPPRVSENIIQKMCQDKSIQRSTRKTIHFDPNATSSNLEVTEVLPSFANYEINGTLHQGIISSPPPTRHTIWFEQNATSDNLEPLTPRININSVSTGSMVYFDGNVVGENVKTPEVASRHQRILELQNRPCELPIPIEDTTSCGITTSMLQITNNKAINLSKKVDNNKINDAETVSIYATHNSNELIQDISMNLIDSPPKDSAPDDFLHQIKENHECNKVVLDKTKHPNIDSLESTEKTFEYNIDEICRPFKPLNKLPDLDPKYSIENFTKITNEIRELIRTSKTSGFVPKYERCVTNPSTSKKQNLTFIGATFPATPSVQKLIKNKCNTMLIWKDVQLSNSYYCFKSCNEKYKSYCKAFIQLYITADRDINEPHAQITDIKLESFLLDLEDSFKDLLQLVFLKEMNYNTQKYLGPVENIFQVLEDTNVGLTKVVDFYDYIYKLELCVQVTVIGTRLQFYVYCNGWIQFEIDVSTCLRGSFTEKSITVLEGQDNENTHRYLSLTKTIPDDENFAYNFIMACKKLRR